MTLQPESSRPASHTKEGDFAGKSVSRRELFLLGGVASIALLFPGCGGSGSAASSTSATSTTSGTTGTAASPQNLIYFASNRSVDGTYRIYSMNPDGSNVTDISAFDPYEVAAASGLETFDPSQLQSLSFSADGTGILASYLFILYPITGDPNLNEGNGIGMLYVSLKTGVSHNLLSTMGLMGSTGVISPDGTKIMYTPFYEANSSGTEIYALHIAGVDGSSPTVRYSTTNSSMALAPLGFGSDNATVYGYTTTTNSLDLNVPQTYYRLDPGSNTPVAVTTLPGNLGNRTISPNGTQIVSTTYSTSTSKAEVAIASISGANQKVLTSGAENDMYPVFSYDGTKIYFVSNRNGNDEIYAMNTDGTGVTRLTYNFADDTHPISRGTSAHTTKKAGHVRLFR